MEGYLSKWTNYLKGWQQRWFVLKDGILSYYNTQNDSINGDCKRSFKISMFDIIVNKNDNTRVDLILPNEQYLYLKASDYKERQKWLVALASQKATKPNSNLSQTLRSYSSSSHTIDCGELSDSKLPTLTTYDSTHLLKIKQSELKFYCDLLTQQTHEVKNLLLKVNINENTSLTNRKKSDKSSTEKKSDKKEEERTRRESGSDEDEFESARAQSVLNLSNSGYMSACSSFKSDISNISGETAVDSHLQSLYQNYKNKNKNSNETNKCDSKYFNLSSDSTDTTNTATTSTNDDQLANITITKVAADLDSHSGDEDIIKKIDEVSSNINITCDMLVQIIRNVIVLSNTSTNVGPEALKSLLNEANTKLVAGTAAASGVSHLEQQHHKYHLYHPMYMNNQLTQYNTKSPTKPMPNDEQDTKSNFQK